MSISKVVIPAAGFGTRFLPFTKAIPKEMLPLLNKPAIQHIVEEAIAAGVNNFFIITAPGKEAIEKHFSPSPSLNAFLKEKNKTTLLTDLETIIRTNTFHYILQEKAQGLGHAILMAHHAIGNEYFGVMLPDDIMISNPAGLAQLATLAQKHQSPIIAVQEVPQEHVSHYGIIAIKKKISGDLFEIERLVEKPSATEAPSNLAIIGRYILAPTIFDELTTITPSAGGELQLTDALDQSIKKGQRMLAYIIKGNRFDIGTPGGWLQANTYIASHNA